MKRFLSLLAVGAVAASFASSADAQVTGRTFSARNFQIDDNVGHTMLIGTPPVGSIDYTIWQATGFQPLTFNFPVPPTTSTPSGFVNRGTAAGNLLYWIPENIGMGEYGQWAVATGFNFDNATNTLQMGTTTSKGHIQFDDGAPANAFTGDLRALTSLTANRTWDLPDASGIISLGGIVNGTVDGSTLRWDSGVNKWVENTLVNQPIAGGLNVTGAVTGTTTADFAGTGTFGGGATNFVVLGTSATNDISTSDASLDVTGAITATTTVDAEGTGTFGAANSVVLGGVGNEIVAADGTINTTSGLNVNGGMFTVNATNGNTLVAGTLDQTAGQVTLNGNVDAKNGLDVTTANLTVGGTNFTVAPATGNTTTLGTLDVTGNARFRTSNASTITLSPTTMNLGDYVNIVFADPDAGTGPVELRYFDNSDPALRLIGGALQAGTPGTINFRVDASTGNMTNVGNINLATAVGSTSAIGNVANFGNISVGNTGAGTGNITLNSSVTGNIVLNGVDADAVPTQMITLNGSNQVRTTPLSGSADEGVIFSSGKYRLGGATTTEVPFASNRFVNLNASNLSFTSNGGGLTPVKITGGAAPALDVVATTGITGATTISGNTLINNASGTNATTGINTTSGTGAVGIGNAATTAVNLNGVAINATGATTVTGTLTQGTGQVTLNGNVDATNGLDVTTANLTVGGASFTVAPATGLTTSAGGVQVSGKAAFPLDITATSVRAKTATGGWDGAGAFGGANATIIAGEFGTIAQIGAHSATLSAWAPLYINSGGTNVRVGSTALPNSTLDVAGSLENSGNAKIATAAASTTELGNVAGFGNISVGNVGAGTGNITLNSSVTGDIVLNGVDADAVPTEMLTLTNAGKQVRVTTLSGSADEGVIFSSGKYRLGGATSAEVPFASNRFVNLNASNLSFTRFAGAETALSLAGGTGGAVGINTGTGNVTAGNATGTTAINGANVNVTGVTNINASANNNTNINTGTSTGTVAIGNSLATTTVLGTTNINNSGAAATNIGAAGTGNTAIGNATGTTSITGSNWSVTTAGDASLKALTSVGIANINNSGTAITNIGNTTGTTTLTGTTNLASLTANRPLRLDASKNITSTLIDVSDNTNTVTGVAKIANGGTNSGTALSGSSIMISNGTSIVQGAAGTTTTVLHGNAAGAPTYSAVALTTDVTGILPIANGGTNSSTALNNNRMMLSSGGSIVEGGALTNGQFFIGATAGAPAAGTLAVTGTVDADLSVMPGANTLTLNVPDAGAAARGVVTTLAQTFAGAKTFTSALTASATGNTFGPGVAANGTYITVNGANNIANYEVDITGDLRATGTANIGTLVLTGNLLPTVDNTQDIGEITTPLRWRKVYVGPGSFHTYGTALEVGGTARDWAAGITNTGNYTIGEATGGTNRLTLTPAGALTTAAGITATTGNISTAVGNISSAGTVTGATGVIATTGGVLASAGNVTATLGDINAVGGNLQTNGVTRVANNGDATLQATTTTTLTAAGLVTGNLGATVTGAAVNLNAGATAASNFATNINNGTSTGAVGIGNSLAGNVSLASGGTIGLTGTTAINTTGAALTTIGSTATGGNVSINAAGGNSVDVRGATTINTAGTAGTTIGNITGAVGITGVTVGVTGNTSINTTGSGSTSIGLGGGGNVTISGPVGINSSTTNATSIGNTSNTLTLVGSPINMSSSVNLTGRLTLSGGASPLNVGALDGTLGQVLISSGAGATPAWTSTLTGVTIPFSQISSGTNITAAMVVGTGASLNFTAAGTINASTLLGGTWAVPGTIGSTTPNTGAFTTLSANNTVNLNAGSANATNVGTGTGNTAIGNATGTTSITGLNWGVTTAGAGTLTSLNAGSGTIVTTGAVNGGSTTITGLADLQGGVNLGNAAIDAIALNGTMTLSGTGSIVGGANLISGSNFDINGGAIDGTPIGATTPAAGTFTALTATTDLTLNTGLGTNSVLTEGGLDKASGATETFAFGNSGLGVLNVTVDGNLSAGSLSLSGNLDMATNIITNIGNAGTDFVAATGGLNLAGDLNIGAGKFTAAAATGNTLVGGTLDVSGVISSTAGNVTITDATDITGATTINNTGIATTQIGNVAGFGNVTIGNNGLGAGLLNLNSGATGSVNVVGPTNINLNANNNTNINSGTSTGTVAIGNSASTTTVLGVTNINNTGAAATNIGNTAGGTAISTATLSGTTTITGNVTGAGLNRFAERVATTNTLTQVIPNTLVTATSVIIVSYEDPAGGGIFTAQVDARVAATSFTVRYSAAPPAGKFLNYMIINP